MAASAAIFASLGVGTLGAYTASITNDGNQAGAGSLVMQESGPGADGQEVTCTSTDGEGNAATCTSINKYGGDMNMVPGSEKATTVTISNTGTVPATSFTLAAGACSAAGNTADACGVMTVKIADGGNEVFSGTAAELAGQSISLTAPVAPGDNRPFTVTVGLPESVESNLQGGTISQPLTWTFQA
ncbi:hypothetical protein [Corynebacterium frankenforstense]